MAKHFDSKFVLDVPMVDLPTLIFSSGDAEQRARPQYFDAEHPERWFSLQQAEVLVKRLGMGLQKLGLQPNDKVLLFSTNSLYFPVLYWGVVAAGCVFTGCSPSASAAGKSSVQQCHLLGWRN